MNQQRTPRQQADRLLAVLRHATRFWRTGLILLIVGGAASVGVALIMPRVYRSEALILYRERISASAVSREEAFDPARRIGLRLREVVLSRSRLEQVIDKFKLYPDIIESKGMADAVDLMRTKVTFKSREGDTYALSYEGEDPEVVQKVTLWLTEALVAENERSAAELASGTKDFLDAETKRVEEDLRKKEEALAKFLREHPAFAAEAARVASTGGSGITAMVAAETFKKTGASVPVKKKSSDPRVEALEREADRIRARLSPEAQTVPTPSMSPEAKEAAEEWNRKKQEAARELQMAQREVMVAKQSFTDEHPDVKRAKGRVQAAMHALEEIQLMSVREMAKLQGRTPPPMQPLTPEDRQRLQADLQRVQQDIARYRAQAARRDSEKDKLREPTAGSAESDADHIVRLESTWAQLTREVGEAQEQRSQLEAKRFTAEIRDRMTHTEGSARMLVVDQPYKPTRPVRGARTQTALIGGGVSLFVTLLVMLFLALLDERVYSAYDVEQLGIAPLLTTVPRPDRQTEKQLRTARQLELALRLQGPRAPAPQERAEKAGQDQVENG